MAEAEQFAWNSDCARIAVAGGEGQADTHAFYRSAGYTKDSNALGRSGELKPVLVGLRLSLGDGPREIPSGARRFD